MSEKNEPEQTQMKIRIDADLVAWCHAEAANQQRTVGFFVENALKRYRAKIELDRRTRANRKR